MSKRIILASVVAALLLSIPTIAGDLIEHPITTTIVGNNVNFQINTYNKYMADQFSGTADFLNLTQTYKTHEYTAGYPNWYTFNGIERIAGYNDIGSLTIATRYTDNDSYSYADMQLNAHVNSDAGGQLMQIVNASGGLGENLVHSINHYTVPIEPTMTTPPSMNLQAAGDFVISYGATDIRNNNNPDQTFDYDFGFYAKGDTSAMLDVTKASVLTEHSRNDQFSTAFNFWYDGSLVEQNTSAFGYNQVDFSQTNDVLNHYISATAKVQ